MISSILESYYGVWPGHSVTQSLTHSQSKFQMFGNQTKGKTSFSVQCWEAVLQPDTVYYLSWLFISSTLALSICVEIIPLSFEIKEYIERSILIYQISLFALQHLILRTYHLRRHFWLFMFISIFSIPVCYEVEKLVKIILLRS